MKFSKASSLGEMFDLVKCRQCGFEFLGEVPDEKEIAKYYEKQYFTKRTDRGYDNYFSDKLRQEISRVFKLNLEDLGFFEFEESLPAKKFSLDIGCAAGYFVDYMQQRGWNSYGVDVSGDCVDFAKKNRLNVEKGDYLKIKFVQKFNLITMWATIEHLHRPDFFIDKIYRELDNNGRLLISTCRSGFNFRSLHGSKWRFYNFPEHIYFFSYRNIRDLLEQRGFEINAFATYGSDFGKAGTLARKLADKAAKRFNLGDMMIISAIKKQAKAEQKVFAKDALAVE